MKKNQRSLKTISLNQFIKDETLEERKLIDQEKKYYEVVVSLREKRQELGLTQLKLAEKAKLPRTTITKVESGERNVTLQTMMAMAQAMNKKIDIRLY